MSAAADGVSRSSQYGQYCADNEEDHSGGDHDMYLVSADMSEGRSAQWWERSISVSLKRCGVASLDRWISRCAAGDLRQ
ncbi:hypothetical protein GCM10009641_17290 [Mycobacterium cookii]|uniref:Uncharacterized protein n=1 Tax=Mycobacterium cookii TaxID=1775 RepID=A0A7I7L138_9MYCO|nr:hypothetical protein MCOO_35460 [Mycobacterium cookii]